MKIIVLIIAVFALNDCVTRATSIDPIDHVDTDQQNSQYEDSRTKRSGSIFSSLLNKKLGLLGSLAGSSSGKSLGPPEHYEEPLSYNTKSFNLWGVKKAILSSVFEAAKAITGGVIALKGQLIKAKGHAVVAKGKLMQTKGEAISNFGKNIATHAFETHHDDIHAATGPGVYNHVPPAPIHHPTSYGATGYAYQQPMYVNTAYQIAPSNYQTGFGGQPGYGGGLDYNNYGGGGFTAKRAVNNAQDSSNRQIKSPFDKDSVQAGLLIFKPIKMHQNGALAGNGLHSNNMRQIFNDQRPQTFTSNPNLVTESTGGSYKSHTTSFPTRNPGYQGQSAGYQGQSGGYQGHSAEFQDQPAGFPFQDFGNGFSSQQNVVGYPTQQYSGYPVAQQPGAYQVPPGSAEQISSLGYTLQGFNLQQLAGHGFGNQFQNQGNPSPYSAETSYTDQNNAAASELIERVAQSAHKNVLSAETPRKTIDADSKADGFSIGASRPASAQVRDDEQAFTKKQHQRSVPKRADDDVPFQTKIVPSNYRNSESSAEDQEKLKKTVQKFFNLLEKHRCKYI